jgi:CRP-like cAMP-binding protein
LIKEDYFGEIEFFSDEPRKLTARARDFSECYVISKEHFMHIAEDYINAI